jgi:hypothetical protein
VSALRTLVLVAAVAALVSGCGISSDVSRDVGARCESKDDCNDRCLLPTQTEAPGGFCTLQCVDDGDCPGDASCIDLEGGVCLFSCSDDTGCEFLGAGWACLSRDGRPSGQAMVCIGN